MGVFTYMLAGSVRFGKHDLVTLTSRGRKPIKGLLCWSADPTDTGEYEGSAMNIAEYHRAKSTKGIEVVIAQLKWQEVTKSRLFYIADVDDGLTYWRRPSSRRNDGEFVILPIDEGEYYENAEQFEINFDDPPPIPVQVTPQPDKPTVHRTQSFYTVDEMLDALRAAGVRIGDNPGIRALSRLTDHLVKDICINSKTIIWRDLV